MTDPVDAAGAASPVRADERIEAIDIVRGLALFGVLVVNLLTGFRVSLFQHYFVPHAAVLPPVDRLITGALAVAIETKAFVVFSLLFGVGLGIQQARLRDARYDFTAFAARRLGVLLGLGLVHLVLIWNGDILVEYAVAGFLILPLLRCRGSVVAVAAAAAMALFISNLATRLPTLFHGWLAAAELASHVDLANRVYGGGDFVDILRFRIHETRYIAALLLAVLPRTMALFLVGLLAVRHGILQRPEQHARLLKTVATIGLTAGGLASLLRVLSPATYAGPGVYAAALDKLAPVVLGVGYFAGLLLLLADSRGRGLLRVVAPVGRMALSNYLTQSIIFGFIFYGYGLALFNRLGVGAALLIGVSVFLAQVVASRWWLRRYRSGPVEWLWRSLTYANPRH